MEKLSTYLHRPILGGTSYGRTHKYEVAGRKVYVTVNRNADAEIVEVFINVGRPSDQEASAAGIIGRLISLGLKHGVPPQDIINHLSGHQDQTGGVVPGVGIFTSMWDAVARALQEETDLKADTSHLRETCPTCGSPMAREEGCLKCYSCGYSAEQ